MHIVLQLGSPQFKRTMYASSAGRHSLLNQLYATFMNRSTSSYDHSAGPDVKLEVNDSRKFSDDEMKAILSFQVSVTSSFVDWFRDFFYSDIFAKDNALGCSVPLSAIVHKRVSLFSKILPVEGQKLFPLSSQERTMLHMLLMFLHCQRAFYSAHKLTKKSQVTSRKRQDAFSFEAAWQDPRDLILVDDFEKQILVNYHDKKNGAEKVRFLGCLLFSFYDFLFCMYILFNCNVDWKPHFLYVFRGLLLYLSIRVSTSVYVSCVDLISVCLSFFRFFFIFFSFSFSFPFSFLFCFCFCFCFSFIFYLCTVFISFFLSFFSLSHSLYLSISLLHSYLSFSLPLS
jgi:hypothetical protein